MTLALAAPEAAPGIEQATGIVRFWLTLGLGGRVAIVGAAGVLSLVLLGWGAARLARSSVRGLLLALASISGLGFAALGYWVSHLPELKGNYFVLSHQIARGGAALCGTFFVLFTMLLVMPAVMDRIGNGGFVAFVAMRHVRAGRSGFLTVISALSIIGVALSSWALCATISVMGGFGADLKRKILGNNAHIRVDTVEIGGFEGWRDALDDVRLVPGVKAATPVAGGEAMASSNSNTAGVLVRGVETESIGGVIDLPQNIEVGELAWLDDPHLLANLPPETPIGIASDGHVFTKGPDFRRMALSGSVDEFLAKDDEYPGVIVGRELAKTLHVVVGDVITLVSPLGDLGPMGVLPKSRKFRIAAVFYSGMFEYDASQLYMRLDVAQEFLDLGPKITGIDVKVETAELVGQVTPRVAAAMAPLNLRVRDWQALNKNLFSALALEKIGGFLLLSIAIMVSSFCIVCTLLLMVSEKSKEIAVLKALGASDNAIMRVFMAEGVVIGGIGTVFGVTLALVTALGLKWFGVRLDPDVYYVDRLPISVDPWDYTFVALAALAITTLATVYPALAASRLRPVEGIRWE